MTVISSKRNYFMLSKQNIRCFLVRCFYTATSRLSTSSRDGVKIAAKAALRKRFLLVGLLFSNLIAGVFEGGTMGILALAVSTLTQTKSTAELAENIGALGDVLVEVLPGTGSGGLFLILVLLAVTAQIMKSLMTYVGERLSVRLQFSVNQELQRQATDQIMAYSLAQVTAVPAGALSSMIGQVTKVAALIGVLHRGMLSICMFLAYLVTMLVLSVPLAISALVLMFLIWLAFTRLPAIMEKLGEKAYETGLLAGKSAFEFLQAPRLLRIFGATGFAAHQINSLRAQSLAALERAAKIKAAIDPTTDAVTIAAAGLFLVVGYFVSKEDALTVIPSLLLFLLILNRMVPQAKVLNQIRIAIAINWYTVGAMGQFLSTHDKEYTRLGGMDIEGLRKDIVFENVSFMYPNTKSLVLRDISFKVRKGQTVAVVGGSGAGKSTVASLLIGLYEPTGGEISVDGQPLSTIRPGSWCQQIGVVDQETFLVNATVRENIAFAQEECSLESIVLAAKRTFAHDFIEDLPDGYDTVIGDRGFRLSGGQQQRLALARALLREPEVLILDEATSSLDSESEHLIQKTLENLGGDITIFVIAHRLSTINKAHEIIVLEGGVVAERGTFRDLVSRGGRFAQLWDYQKGSD